MASWQAFCINTLLRLTMKRATAKGMEVADIRRAFGTPRAQILKVWPGWSVRPLEAEGLAFESCDRAEPPALRDDLAVLYLHGGGYFFGSPQTHRQLALNMAQHCDAPVFSLDYRLAPEHPYPAALEDAVAAFRWLYRTQPDRSIVVAGDSAGGGLAIATALALVKSGDRAPAALVTFSPWTDLAGTGASVDANDRRCAMFTAKGVRAGAVYYTGRSDPRDPGLSPLYADLKGLPPIQIFASTDEVLRDDSVRFADKARAAGVECELNLRAGVPHVWPLFARLLPEGRESLRQVQAFVERVVPRRQRRAA